jgi:hypothetical protein
MSIAEATPRPTLRRIFDRLDVDQQGIDREKVEQYLDDLGIGGGLFGGMRISKAAEHFMARFDPEGAGRVTWEQFKGSGRRILPPGIVNPETGQLDPTRAESVFKEISGGKPTADVKAVKNFIEPKLTGAAALLSGTIADGIARVTVDALDANGDKVFTVEDLQALVDDINLELTGRTSAQ